MTVWIGRDELNKVMKMLNKTHRKGAGILLNAVCILAAVLLIGAGFLMVAGIKPAIVTSGSMEPVIHTGSMVFIDEDERDIVKRDIIAFDSGGTLVTHRVVDVNEEGLVTKGDANDSRDPGVVGKGSLRGKVIMWIPWLGYGVKALSSPAGIIVMLTLWAVLLLLSSVKKPEGGRHDRKKDTAGSNGSAA